MRAETMVKSVLLSLLLIPPSMGLVLGSPLLSIAASNRLGLAFFIMGISYFSGGIQAILTAMILCFLGKWWGNIPLWSAWAAGLACFAGYAAVSALHSPLSFGPDPSAKAYNLAALLVLHLLAAIICRSMILWLWRRDSKA